jgi:FtsZ-interacting cell division protein YlmF
MDLSLFHIGNDPVQNRKKDKKNSRTQRFQCRRLEWMGHYSTNIRQRLLGHYRLFQHYKVYHSKFESPLPVVQSYVLQYRAWRPIKRKFSAVVYFMASFITDGYFLPAMEIEVFNQVLLNEGYSILEEFLSGADDDFESALRTALQKLQSPALFDKSAIGSKPPEPAFFLHIQNEYKNYIDNSSHHIEFNEHNHLNQYNQHNELNQDNQFNEYNQFNQHNEFNQLNVQNINNDISFESTTNNTEYHHHNTTKNGAQGKEAGVFSKLQLLILFDLLYEAADIEKIDLAKPNKFDDVASLFHALTGKTKESWLQELKDHQKSGLYAFHTEGEKSQLIGTLVNLGETFRKAGFRSIAKLADRKIKELERTKKGGPVN